MTKYESELMERFNKHFSSGKHHYSFDAPSDPKELERLKNALASLDKMAEITVIASPWTSGDDFIEVEKLPSCVTSKH